MAVYGVTYLRYLRTAVEEFASAFEDWMATQGEADHSEARGLLPTVWTRDGEDTRVVRELETEVAERAGAAARAVQVTGTYMGIQGSARSTR